MVRFRAEGLALRPESNIFQMCPQNLASWDVVGA
jgi:hypothetical protein